MEAKNYGLAEAFGQLHSRAKAWDVEQAIILPIEDVFSISGVVAWVTVVLSKVLLNLAKEVENRWY